MHDDEVTSLLELRVWVPGVAEGSVDREHLFVAEATKSQTIRFGLNEAAERKIRNVVLNSDDTIGPSGPLTSDVFHDEVVLFAPFVVRMKRMPEGAVVYTEECADAHSPGRNTSPFKGFRDGCNHRLVWT